uniref:Metalloendopeptidase n=1 Tax=Ciona savignyi TaxID=51511 RepID=H2YLP5_CIOSA
CIRFVPRRAEVAYIFISNGKGCWAYVGKTGYSSQTVSLGIPGCVAKGIVLHEFMHVVGFQHEHSRNDRDRYVQIVRQNIQGDMTMNFDRYNDTVNYVVYDYNSVMHYSKTAFSKQIYLPSIQVIPKRKPEPIIGQRERLSPYDIEEVKYLYSCARRQLQRLSLIQVCSINCTFDNDLCGWTHITLATTDDFNWIRHKGKTSSGGTGPLNDHTYGTNAGYYMYVEGSRPRVRNHVAILSTPRIGVSAPQRCVTFWYHMWGNGMGTLDVSADSGRTTLSYLKNVAGNQGTRWKNMQVQYNPPRNARVAFRIEGVVGNDYRSDIAVDDISIHPGNC